MTADFQVPGDRFSCLVTDKLTIQLMPERDTDKLTIQLMPDQTQVSATLECCHNRRRTQCSMLFIHALLRDELASEEIAGSRVTPQISCLRPRSLK